MRSIHAQNRPVEQGEAGQRCALVLSGPQISKDAVRRGDVVLDPALHAPTARIDASLRVLPSEPRPIGQWFPVKVHHAAAEVPGRMVVLRDRPIAPGETDYVQLVLERPIAGGRRRPLRHSRHLVQPHRRRRHIHRSARARAAAAHARAPHRDRSPGAAGSGQRAVARVLAGPGAWTDLDAFVRDRALGRTPSSGSPSADLALVVLPTKAGRAAMLPADWERLRAHIGRTLDAFHAERPDLPGIGLEQLRKRREAALPAPAFLGGRHGKLAEAGDVALDRTWVRRPGHQVKFSAEEERIWALVRPRLAGEPYRPPRVRDIAKAMTSTRPLCAACMRMAARRGDVEEIAHDHFFLRPVVQQMAEIAIDVAAHARRRAGLRRPSSATVLTTAARWRSRSSSFSIGTGSRSAARTCAASIRRASSSSRPRRRRQQTEESRSRWGDRTSNPGGAVRRSQVGSTPILLRHPPTPAGPACG